jgi:hypothetical protein
MYDAYAWKDKAKAGCKGRGRGKYKGYNPKAGSHKAKAKRYSY